MDNNKEDWFESWFDSPYYHLLYQHRNDEEAQFFITNLCQSIEIPKCEQVLDLACGKGRHSKYLHSLGYCTTGIDLSKESIKKASEYAQSGLEFFVADMRNFELNKKYGAIFNLFTSFGYFSELEDNKKVLHQIYNHLKPHGWLVIDYLNPTHSSISDSPKVNFKIEEIEFETQKFIQDHCICKNIEVNDGGRKFHFYERVQLLELNWFKEALQEAGFEVENVLGNYELDDFNAETSQRMIVLARKK